MARVTVELPPLLTDETLLIGQLSEAARVGLDAVLPGEMLRIAQSGRVPRHTGALQRAVLSAAQPARVEGSRIVAEIVVAGEVSAYAAVQDLGRTPGKRAPPTAAIKRWVELKLRDQVNDLARKLQAEYQAAHPRRKRRGGKTPSRALAKFRARAVFLLTRSIRRHIAVRGTQAHGFIAGEEQRIAEAARRAVETEIEILVQRFRGGSS